MKTHNQWLMSMAIRPSDSHAMAPSVVPSSTKAEAGETARIQARFHVFDDSVYSYEYDLANRELAQLLDEEPLTSGLSNGTVLGMVDPSRVSHLARRLAYYDTIESNDQSVVTHQKQLSSVGGAIASSSGKAYMTHWIYPYKGKFHPQMIRALLNIMGVKEGETVFDPMTGSGTVNVEAALMGIDSIGMDISPVGVLASQVKYDLLREAVAGPFAEAIPSSLQGKSAKNTLDIYHGEKSNEESHYPKGPVGDALKLLDFEVMSICQLPGKDRGAIWAKLSRYYRGTAIKCPKMVRKLGIKLGKARISRGDARKTGLPSDSLDGIICSPPYAIALDYVARNGAQLEELGHSVDDIYDVTIGLRGKKKDRVENYYLDLEASIAEMHRVLRHGRFATVVIGDTRFDNKLLPTIKRAIDFGEKAGLNLTANMRKVSAGRFGLFRTESMLLFQKPY